MVVLILTREEGMLIHRSMPRLPTQTFLAFHQKYGPWIGFLSKLMTLGPPKVAIDIEWCDSNLHFFFENHIRISSGLNLGDVLEGCGRPMDLKRAFVCRNFGYLVRVCGGG